ncbi:hypothetical protein ACLKA7_015122 [Drosophila subpalustris]
MSQHRATSSNDGSTNNSEQIATNTNNAIVVLDDSDNEDDDIQFVGTSPALPAIPMIDLCVSPSTSAAAAAAAAASATVSNIGAGDSLKANNIETVATSAASDDTSVADTPTPTAALECPICLQTCIHPARLPCGHIFCFLCVKGVAYKNRRCAMCRREIPAEFLDHPQLVNGIDDICATRATEDGYQWYYEGRNGGWWAYDVRTNEDIETAFKAYEEYIIAHPEKKVTAEAPLEGGVVDAVVPAVAQREQTRDQNLPMDWTQYLEEDYYDYAFAGFIEEEDYEAWSSDSSSDYEFRLGINKEHPSKLHQLICGQMYIIDLVHMTQTLLSQPTKKRNIIRRKSSEPTPDVKGDIEEAFKKGDKSCSILVAGYVYIVDLEQLVQQRQNEPTRCRRVKRDLATIPKKGVAGLRIEGNQVTSDTVFSRPSNPTPTAAASGGPSSFISTIIARDAAIRIASDIIGSTLAHADELTRGLAASNISDSANDLSGEQTYSNPQQSSTAGAEQQQTGIMGIGASRSLASSHSNSIQDLMLSATEDLLDTTQQVIETNQHTIDLFEQALNDFQALTMRNFEDSSDEDDDDDGNVNDVTNASVLEQLEASEPHDGHNGPLSF